MRLRLLTWLCIGVGLFATIAALIQWLDGVRALSLDVMSAVSGEYAAMAWGQLIVSGVRNVSYELGWFATAAMVEFLVRIWRELTAIRAGMEKR